jgi:hypothetical protein
MLLRGLQGIQYGLAVQVDSWREELTLLEVADILKTSRPFVVHLVQTGVLPTHPGKGRERVWIADVVAYRRRLRNQALNQVDIEDEGPESTGERAGEGDPASEI